MDLVPAAQHSRKVKTTVKFGDPESHALPARAIWTITVLIAVLVAITNSAMVIMELQLLNWKFGAMQEAFDEGGVLLGALSVAAFSAVLALVAASLVHFVSPICAGSGIPELKGYWNGNYVNDLFTVQAFLVRSLCAVLSVSSGFPVGREGPMVAIGGTLGYGVAHFLALPHMQTWLRVGSGADVKSRSAAILDERRFDLARRIGCVLGGAAGIAVAFNAPIGGILYMFEEVTNTDWVPELTFRAFVTSVLAAFVTRVIARLTGWQLHQLLLYEDSHQGVREWRWPDLILFVFVACIGGLFAVIFSQVLAMVWAFRRKWKDKVDAWHPWAKILEAAMYCVLCGSIFALVPLLGHCELIVPADEAATNGTTMEHSAHHGRRLQESSSLAFVQYTCEEGSHNEVATLLLTGAEGAVKHLYSRHAQPFQLASLALAFVPYAVLAMGMPGLAVPMGMFVPNMLLGAIMGRFIGEAVARPGLGDPGIYAMVGSAAMLGGFTHMTVAIVVLLVEAARDLDLVSALMMAIVIAQVVSKVIAAEGYDHVLVHLKRVPFLDPDMPERLDTGYICARDLCDPVPREAQLSCKCAIASVQQALAQDRINHFPVMATKAPKVCIGLISRVTLEAVVECVAPGASNVAKETSEKGMFHRLHGDTEFDSHDHRATVKYQRQTTKLLQLDKLIHSSVAGAGDVDDAGGPMVPVSRAMDPAPFVLLEDMPAPRFYQLFSKGVCTVACVVSTGGIFRGLLSKRRLIDIHGSDDHQEGRTDSQHHFDDLQESGGKQQQPDPQQGWPAEVDEGLGPRQPKEDGSVTPDEDEDDMTKSRSRLRPESHRLPPAVAWGSTIIVAVAVALTGFAMSSVENLLVSWKLGEVHHLISDGGLAWGILVLAGFCTVYALVAVTLTIVVAPICAGSGIPEAKGFLDGHSCDELFKFKVLLVRSICSTLSVAAGFPIGREGPMVCIGGTIGYIVTYMMGRHYMRRHLDVPGAESIESIYIDEERFEHVKRAGFLMGGAAGICVAFNAPIGGVLYMVEENGVTGWPPVLTFQAAVCTVVATYAARLLLNLQSKDFHKLLIFSQNLEEEVQWQAIDAPFFMILAAFVGICSAIFAKVLAKMTAIRRWMREQPWYQRRQPLAGIAECAAYAILCAVVFGLVPLAAQCTGYTDATEGLAAASTGHDVGHEGQPTHHDDRRLSVWHLSYVQYNCPEGEYNGLATILLNFSEAAVKHLYARESHPFSLRSLAIAVVTYMLLAMGMPGLYVPMGMFIPCLLIGGMMGRFFGEAFQTFDIGTAHEGVYAMVGSAAMLAGFTHMTVAIVVLLVEAAYDLSLVTPLMLAIFVARIVSSQVNRHSFDHVMIHAKRVPVLDPEMPPKLQHLVAAHICTTLPSEALLPQVASLPTVKLALEHEDILEFPVFDRHCCIGVMRRHHLELALDAAEANATQAHGKGLQQQPSQKRIISGWSEEAALSTKKDRYAVQEQELELDGLLRELCLQATPRASRIERCVVSMAPLMDRAPHIVLDEMPVARFYALFSKVGAPSACVVTRRGEFCGIVRRVDIIRAAGHHGHEAADAHHHKHKRAQPVRPRMPPPQFSGEAARMETSSTASQLHQKGGGSGFHLPDEEPPHGWDTESAGTDGVGHMQPASQSSPSGPRGADTDRKLLPLQRRTMDCESSASHGGSKGLPAKTSTSHPSTSALCAVTPQVVGFPDVSLTPIPAGMEGHVDVTGGVWGTDAGAVPLRTPCGAVVGPSPSSTMSLVALVLNSLAMFSGNFLHTATECGGWRAMYRWRGEGG